MATKRSNTLKYMDTETFKSKYQSMVDILLLAPARQAQTYYNIIVDTASKSITINPTLEYFLTDRTGAAGEKRLQALMTEAEFHIGLAVGCLENWLDLTASSIQPTQILTKIILSQ